VNTRKPMKANRWKLRRIFEKIDAKIFLFLKYSLKVFIYTHHTTPKKTRCHLLFHLGNSAPYGLFHATLLELVFNYKNQKKLSKKLSVIPTSSDRIMIVVLVVVVDVLDAVKKIKYILLRYYGIV
jgi:hypothetical protein